MFFVKNNWPRSHRISCEIYTKLNEKLTIRNNLIKNIIKLFDGFAIY